MIGKAENHLQKLTNMVTVSTTFKDNTMDGAWLFSDAVFILARNFTV